MGNAGMRCPPVTDGEPMFAPECFYRDGIIALVIKCHAHRPSWAVWPDRVTRREAKARHCLPSGAGCSRSQAATGATERERSVSRSLSQVMSAWLDAMTGLRSRRDAGRLRGPTTTFVASPCWPAINSSPWATAGRSASFTPQPQSSELRRQPPESGHQISGRNLAANVGLSARTDCSIGAIVSGTGEAEPRKSFGTSKHAELQGAAKALADC